MSRRNVADNAQIVSGQGEPYRRVNETARHFAISRQTLARLHEQEGLPATVLTESSRTIRVNGKQRSGYERRGRRTLLFRWTDVEAWLAGCRQRQIRGVLDGQRYMRRSGNGGQP